MVGVIIYGISRKIPDWNSGVELLVNPWQDFYRNFWRILCVIPSWIPRGISRRTPNKSFSGLFGGNHGSISEEIPSEIPVSISGGVPGISFENSWNNPWWNSESKQLWNSWRSRWLSLKKAVDQAYPTFLNSEPKLVKKIDGGPFFCSLQSNPF